MKSKFKQKYRKSFRIDMPRLIVSRESYGSETTNKEYVKREDGMFSVVQNTEKLRNISQFFRSVFLPQGYPESVSEDYLQYQIWDTVQAFASSITGSLATQAILKGVGVGEEGATVMAATITWLLKDGTGMIGRIGFAWLQGSGLDCDCKRWRLFADILNDTAIFLDLLAPHFKAYFRFIVCVAGVSKSIVGVAGGATRAALTQHQARRNNMADVSAKDGSQETLVNLGALILSLTLIPIVTGKPVIIWTLYILCTMLHLFANYRAVTCVTMETLNQARLHIIIHNYLASPDKRIMGVRAANAKEPVLWSTRRKVRIHLGCSLSEAVNSFEELEYLVNLYKGRNYILSYNSKKASIHIVLHRRSHIEDQIKACLQAEILDFVLSHKRPEVLINNIHLHALIDAVQTGDTESLVAISATMVKEAFPQIKKQLLDQGWTMDCALMGSDEWRALWDLNGLPDKKTF